MSELVDHLREVGALNTPELIQAFVAVRREDFVMPDMKGWAEADEALPLSSGQTISQPYTVAFMLEKLQPHTGDTILDIGSGSGWTTALLAQIVGSDGKVISIEVLPELAAFGKTNISKYNFIEKGIVEVHCANGKQGYKAAAPYNGILVSAALGKKELPKAWKEQLRVGGRIVVPIQDSIWLFTKTNEKTFTEKEFPGFAFVPFI